MPANNVNCEALRLVVECAKQHVSLMKELGHAQEPKDAWDELETAIWMLERHVRKFDEANG